MIGTLIIASAFITTPTDALPQRKIIETPPVQRERLAPQISTVAIIPWSFTKGTETAEKTAKETVMALFTGANKSVVPESVTNDYWVQEFGGSRGTHIISKDGIIGAPLPTPQDMLRLGRAMGVDYVSAGRASWHTRSIWVGLGPKTKATCTVDTILIDVKKAEIILEMKNVSVDSHKKETTAETAAAILIHFGFTAISGGPKTPHQQKSAQLAIGEAMEPWLKTQVTQRPQKIDGA